MKGEGNFKNRNSGEEEVFNEYLKKKSDILITFPETAMK